MIDTSSFLRLLAATSAAGILAQTVLLPAEGLLPLQDPVSGCKDSAVVSIDDGHVSCVTAAPCPVQSGACVVHDFTPPNDPNFTVYYCDCASAPDEDPREPGTCGAVSGFVGNEFEGVFCTSTECAFGLSCAKTQLPDDPLLWDCQCR